MKRRRLSSYASALVGVLGLAAALGATPAAAEEPDRAEAVAAAKPEATHWLDALDTGRYAESWDDAAGMMKEGRNQQEWVRDVASPRQAFGKSVMRELQRAEFSTAVPGAPSDNYVTVIYLTPFANAPPVYETILLTLEDDHWRIAGYSIERVPEAPAPARIENEPGPDAGAKSKG